LRVPRCGVYLRVCPEMQAGAIIVAGRNALGTGLGFPLIFERGLDGQRPLHTSKDIEKTVRGRIE